MEKDSPRGMGGCQDGTAPGVQLRVDTDRALGEALNFHSAEPRDNSTPLGDSWAANTQRPRDIRGTLKVINNIFFEHATKLTTVTREKQPRSTKALLTLVNMAKLPELRDRLRDAMKEAGVTAAELASHCKVSRPAMSKLLSGDSKNMKAATLASAAKRLGVRDEWLLNGKLPRERAAGEDIRQTEKILALLDDLRGPISALAKAMEELAEARKDEAKRG